MFKSRSLVKDKEKQFYIKKFKEKGGFFKGREFSRIIESGKFEIFLESGVYIFIDLIFEIMLIFQIF